MSIPRGVKIRREIHRRTIKPYEDKLELMKMNHKNGIQNNTLSVEQSLSQEKAHQSVFLDMGSCIFIQEDCNHCKHCNDEIGQEAWKNATWDEEKRRDRKHGKIGYIPFDFLNSTKELAENKLNGGIKDE
jgi:hypothetical protein